MVQYQHRILQDRVFTELFLNIPAHPSHLANHHQQRNIRPAVFPLPPQIQDKLMILTRFYGAHHEEIRR
jgi:hypothetical protein